MKINLTKLEALAEEERKLAAKIAELEEKRSTARSAIMTILSQPCHINAGIYEIVFAAAVQRSIDAKALREAHPRIAEEFTRETPYMKLTVR